MPIERAAVETESGPAPAGGASGLAAASPIQRARTVAALVRRRCASLARSSAMARALRAASTSARLPLPPRYAPSLAWISCCACATWSAASWASA
ncbi:hypothetical protein LP420_38295 [Massilia sp. B-10]|nr:hypothetical protein LP420_38295 [Massilia sp. B-10]